MLTVILVTGDTPPAVKDLVPNRHLRLAAKPDSSGPLLHRMSNLIATGRSV